MFILINRGFLGSPISAEPYYPIENEDEASESVQEVEDDLVAEHAAKGNDNVEEDVGLYFLSPFFIYIFTPCFVESFQNIIQAARAIQAAFRGYRTRKELKQSTSNDNEYQLDADNEMLEDVANFENISKLYKTAKIGAG